MENLSKEKADLFDKILNDSIEVNDFQHVALMKAFKKENDAMKNLGQATLLYKEQRKALEERFTKMLDQLDSELQACEDAAKKAQAEYSDHFKMIAESFYSDEEKASNSNYIIDLKRIVDCSCLQKEDRHLFLSYIQAKQRNSNEESKK